MVWLLILAPQWTPAKICMYREFYCWFVIGDHVTNKKTWVDLSILGHNFFRRHFPKWPPNEFWLTWKVFLSEHLNKTFILFLSINTFRCLSVKVESIHKQKNYNKQNGGHEGYKNFVKFIFLLWSFGCVLQLLLKCGFVPTRLLLLAEPFF